MTDLTPENAVTAPDTPYPIEWLPLIKLDARRQTVALSAVCATKESFTSYINLMSSARDRQANQLRRFALFSIPCFAVIIVAALGIDFKIPHVDFYASTLKPALFFVEITYGFIMLLSGYYLCVDRFRVEVIALAVTERHKIDPSTPVLALLDDISTAIFNPFLTNDGKLPGRAGIAFYGLFGRLFLLGVGSHMLLLSIGPSYLSLQAFSSTPNSSYLLAMSTVTMMLANLVFIFCFVYCYIPFPVVDYSKADVFWDLKNKNLKLSRERQAAWLRREKRMEGLFWSVAGFLLGAAVVTAVFVASVLSHGGLPFLRFWEACAGPLIAGVVCGGLANPARP